jgi:proline dehydrogenase
MLRSFFIALSESKSIRAIAEKSSVGQKLSKRFVAGMTVEELITATEAMNRIGVHVTVDNLGENVTNRAEALESKRLYHQLFDEIERLKLDANVSVKLTHMGLDVDEQLARDNVSELLDHAIRINSFIRVDMEGSPYTQKTLDFVRELNHRPGASGHIGTVLQTYLYRTEEDARVLCSEGIRIRLCKGAYKEPASIAFPSKSDVDANYIKVAKMLLKSGVFHGLATHDEAIINAIKSWALAEGVSKSAFEFQMLNGVRRDLQESLARDGWGVRCYIPFGTEWYPYFMRRLAERPANVIFLAKNYFRG